MLLFLDVISPIPEFFIIEDNKIIYQCKIATNESEKLSDNIIQKYIEIDKELNLNKKLKKLAMTIGPGSYTSLRVGASFLSGLSISMNLKYCPITISAILKNKIDIYKNKKAGVYIYSSNDQKFFCNLNTRNEIIYKKLDNSTDHLPKDLEVIFYNSKEYHDPIRKFEQNKFSFVNEYISNKSEFIFNSNSIIKPIFISNNQTLN